MSVGQLACPSRFVIDFCCQMLQGSSCWESYSGSTALLHVDDAVVLVDDLPLIDHDVSTAVVAAVAVDSVTIPSDTAHDWFAFPLSV